MIWALTQITVGNREYQNDIFDYINAILKDAKNYQEKYYCYYCLSQLGEKQYFDKLFADLKSTNSNKVTRVVRLLLDILEDEKIANIDIYSSKIKTEAKILRTEINKQHKKNNDFIKKLDTK